MSKRSILFLSVFILIISLSFGVSLAQGNNGGNQIAPGDGEQSGNQQPGGEQERQDGPKHFMKPEVHYIGFAVENEKNFEMAHIFLFTDSQKKRGGNKAKMPDGMVEIGKTMYLIVEAKTETEQMKIEPRPGDDESRVPKILKIKSCEGKIAKDDKGNKDGRDNQIEIGQIQNQGQNKKAEEGPKIIGSFKIDSIEKEIGRDKKASVLSGTITIDDKKYTLYLEPRLPPPPPQRGPGGPQEGNGPQNGNGEPPQPKEN